MLDMNIHCLEILLFQLYFGFWNLHYVSINFLHLSLYKFNQPLNQLKGISLLRVYSLFTRQFRPIFLLLLLLQMKFTRLEVKIWFTLSLINSLGLKNIWLWSLWTQSESLLLTENCQVFYLQIEEQTTVCKSSRRNIVFENVKRHFGRSKCGWGWGIGRKLVLVGNILHCAKKA